MDQAKRIPFGMRGHILKRGRTCHHASEMKHDSTCDEMTWRLDVGSTPSSGAVFAGRDRFNTHIENIHLRSSPHCRVGKQRIDLERFGDAVSHQTTERALTTKAHHLASVPHLLRSHHYDLAECLISLQCLGVVPNISMRFCGDLEVDSRGQIW